jgi:hypothetical protein
LIGHLWWREAGAVEHKAVDGNARLQFTGIGLSEVSIRIILSEIKPIRRDLVGRY